MLRVLLRVLAVVGCTVATLRLQCPWLLNDCVVVKRESTVTLLPTNATPCSTCAQSHATSTTFSLDTTECQQHCCLQQLNMRCNSHLQHVDSVYEMFSTGQKLNLQRRLVAYQISGQHVVVGRWLAPAFVASVFRREDIALLQLQPAICHNRENKRNVSDFYLFQNVT